MQVEKNADRVGQYLANQPVLIVPQVMDANPRDGKPFRQMRADRLNQFAPALCGHPQRGYVARGGHAGARRGDHCDPVPVLQVLLPAGITDALVRRSTPAESFDQRVQMIDVVSVRSPPKLEELVGVG